MTEAKKMARKIFREWCAANGVVIYPMAGADLVARIEAALAQSQHQRGTEQ